MHSDSIRDSTLHSVTAITIEIWHLPPRSGFRLPWAGFGKSGKRIKWSRARAPRRPMGFENRLRPTPPERIKGLSLGKLNFLGVSQRTTLRESFPPA
ncbi:hypothetical protein CDAR_507171 [Caerostris darwini]|uniref:Uncharacterized protein n=1 Tax=Caerostris darwini TaxID=1538125 RepID=A0AAV4S2Z5_9ARAC|nr:hypothetical protein CDAR_507171 [Caerostris darwini]